MQEELIRALAHRMIGIADRLGLLDDSVSKALLIDSAQRKWQLPAAFTWTVKGVQTAPPKKETCFRRALTPDKRVQVSRMRQRYSCVTCYLQIEPGSTSCRSCMKLMSKQLVHGHLSPQDSMLRPRRSRIPDSTSSSTLSPPRCRICGFILPGDVEDGLCHVCTCIDIGYFDQDPDWLKLSNSSYSTEDLSSRRPPMLACDMNFYGDASSSFLSSMPDIRDSATSNSAVNCIAAVIPGISQAELEPLPCSGCSCQFKADNQHEAGFGCGTGAGQPHEIENLQRYLV
jgi:hypothetical protein